MSIFGSKFKSSNPMQRESVYEQAYAIGQLPMTVSGTANKLLILSAVMLLGAFLTYYQFIQGHFDFVSLLMKGGVAIGFILAIILAFKPDLTPYIGPVYAFSQGAVVSGASCFLERQFSGIVIQAASLTLLTVFVMALLFSTRIVKVTQTFKSILFASSLTIFVFYLISFILMQFGVNIPYFTQNTPLNIIINVFIVGIAAFYLILDFDFIEQGVQRRAPASFEWYGAFSLLITVIWLYFEILRLLSRFRDR